MFRLIWFKDNNLDCGELQLFRFARHVWGINFSPCIALFTIERLVNENPTNAGQLSLTAIKNNRYMDDLMLTSDSVNDLVTTSRESALLFQSRGFKLRKWVANRQFKSVLSNIPKEDLGSGLGEVDLGTQPMPDSKVLGITWDVENDKLLLCPKK